MKKLTVFAHKRETDALVRRLMRLGCVQIERTDEGADHGRLRLERYGDPAAIDILKSFASEVDINYVEFVEIRNAVEELGGEMTEEKDFSDDPYYKYINHIGENGENPETAETKN